MTSDGLFSSPAFSFHLPSLPSTVETDAEQKWRHHRKSMRPFFPGRNRPKSLTVAPCLYPHLREDVMLSTAGSCWEKRLAFLHVTVQTSKSIKGKKKRFSVEKNPTHMHEENMQTDCYQVIICCSWANIQVFCNTWLTTILVHVWNLFFFGEWIHVLTNLQINWLQFWQIYFSFYNVVF